MWLCRCHTELTICWYFIRKQQALVEQTIQSMKSTSRTCGFVDIILTLYRPFMSLHKMYLNNYTAELMFTQSELVHLVRTCSPSQNLFTQSELVHLVRTCSPSQNLSTQSELVHLVRTCSPSQNLFTQSELKQHGLFLYFN